MLKSRSARFGLAFLSVVATMALARGVSMAQSEPGTAKSDYSGEVQVSGSSDVTVTNTQHSTTTVGGSTDDTGTTPSVTKESNSTVSNNYSLSNDQGGDAAPTLSQNDQADSSQTPAAGADKSGNPAEPQLTQERKAPGDIANRASGHTQAPVLSGKPSDSKPASPLTPKDQGAPVPASPGSGAINAVNGIAGTGGKGALASIFQAPGLLPSKLQIIFLSILFTGINCFISYLRRSGFAHAPRSDDSLGAASSFLFATPRVEMQDLPLFRAVPAFSSVSDTKQLIRWKGGE